MLVIGRRGEIVLTAEVLLYLIEPAHQPAQITARSAVYRLLFKKAGPVVVFKFLTGIDERRPLEEVEERSVVHKRLLILYERAYARLIVVFKRAELVVICGIHALLEIEQVEIMAQPAAALEVVVKGLAHIVVIFNVERGIRIVIKHGIYAAATGKAAEAEMHGLRQPDAAGTHLLYRLTCHFPELQRHERGHIAAEAVHYLRPHAQRFYLIIPQAAVIVVKVDHIRPVAYLVAGLSVRVMVEILRVLAVEHGIRRGVIIHDVYHALHAARMDLSDELLEVLHRAVFRVDGAVVAVCIRAAETAFLSFLADGVDRHKPDYIRAERLDAVKVRNNGEKCPLRSVVPDID